MEQYLCPTSYFDFDSPAVQALAEQIARQNKAASSKELAIASYEWVRDEIRYNPYSCSFDKDSFVASRVLGNGESYCVPKAVLLGAVCRALDIPSRLGLGDVKNHLSSPQLIEYLQSEVFVMHGYIELYLDGVWVKATPAFNASLCALMKVQPLEFDGENDSIFHAYNAAGEKHMEYLRDHGTYADVPTDFILDSIALAYPHLVPEHAKRAPGSLEKDIRSL